MTADYLPSLEEQQRLASGVGALIRAERRARGYSSRQLSRRAVVSHDHVRRLELGLRRPGRRILGEIAHALDPDACDELALRLIEAAGRDLRETSPGWIRWHGRRVGQALAAGVYPLGTELTNRIEAWRELRKADAERNRLIDFGELDDLATLNRIEELNKIIADA